MITFTSLYKRSSVGSKVASFDDTMDVVDAVALDADSDLMQVDVAALMRIDDADLMQFDEVEGHDDLVQNFNSVANDFNMNELNLLDPFGLEIAPPALLTVTCSGDRSALSSEQVKLVNIHFDRRKTEAPIPLSLKAAGNPTGQIYESASCFWSGAPLRSDQIDRLNQWAVELARLNHDLVLHTDNASWNRPEFRAAIEALHPHIKVHIVEEAISFDRVTPKSLGVSLRGLYHHFKMIGQPAGMSDAFRAANEGSWYFDLDEDPALCIPEIQKYCETKRELGEQHLRVPRTMAGFFAARAGHPVMAGMQNNMVRAFTHMKLSPASKFDSSPTKKRFGLMESEVLMQTEPFLGRYFSTVDHVPFGENARIEFPHFFKKVCYGLDPISEGIYTRSPMCLQQAVSDYRIDNHLSARSVLPESAESIGELGWIHCVKHELLTMTPFEAGKHLISMIIRQLYFAPGVHLEHEYGYVFKAHPRLKEAVLSFLNERYNYRLDPKTGVLMKFETYMDDRANAKASKLVKEAIHREQNLIVIELNRSNPDKRRWTDEQYKAKLIDKGLFISPDTQLALPNLETHAVWICSLFLNALQNAAIKSMEHMMADAEVPIPKDALEYLLAALCEESDSMDYYIDLVACYATAPQLEFLIERLPNEVSKLLAGKLNTRHDYRLKPEDEERILPWAVSQKKWAFVEKFYEFDETMKTLMHYLGYSTPLRGVSFNGLTEFQWRIICTVMADHPTHIRQDFKKAVNGLTVTESALPGCISASKKAFIISLCDNESPMRLRQRGPTSYFGDDEGPEILSPEADSHRRHTARRDRERGSKPPATSLQF